MNASLENEVAVRREAEAALRRETARLQLLLEVTTVANSNFPPAEVLRRVLGQICSVAGWQIAHLYEVDGEGEDKRAIPTDLWHLPGSPSPALNEFRQVSDRPLGWREGMVGRVMASGRPEWITDLTRGLTKERAKAAESAGFHQGLAFPVLVGSEAVAVLDFFFHRLRNS